MRAFFSERLSTAVSEIFGSIKITLAEYKEEISLSEEEERQVMDVVTQPKITFYKTGLIFIHSCYSLLRLESLCHVGGAKLNWKGVVGAVAS